MEKEKAIALFTQLSAMQYEVPGDPDEGEEEPYISGFSEPTYECALRAELLDGAQLTPTRRDWSVEVRFSASVFRPEGTDQLRTLLDLGDEAKVSVGFPSIDRVTFS